MPIDIEWQQMPPQRNNNDSEPRLFPRIVNSQVIKEEKLAEMIAAYGGEGRGTVKQVLQDFADVLARLLREGNEVRLPSLGTFRLTVGTDATVHRNTKGSIRSVAVRDIAFQPSEELRTAVGKPHFREVPRNAALVAGKSAEMVPYLDAYFQSHNSITSAEFAKLFSLKRSTAHTRIKELVAQGVLRQTGHNKDTRYERGN